MLPIAVLAILALSLVPSGFRFAFGYQVAQNANIVVGQADFVSNVNPTTSLRLPSNLAYDSSGNFWIADSGNNRVVETPNLVAGGNQQFLDVLGQSGYSIGSPSVTASGLDNPSGMTTDSSGNLWVTDTNNNRILEYPKPFSAPGEGASIVIGQVNPFASAAATTQTGLHFPGDQVFDSTGNLWVADTGNNRILEFKAPFAAGMSASAVLGQAVYTTSASVTSASGLYFPTDAIFDSSGNMWVADGGNNRILEYKAPLATDMNASLVIGQANFNTNASAATQAGLNLPESLAFDSTGNLWVADTFNNRVLEYKAPFSNGMEATTVLGQPDFTSSAPAISKTGLHSPAEVVFNPSGSLWVADADNNRLVEFTTPFANGNGASLVFGQSTYTSSLSQGQQSLYQPQAVTSDSSGNLWVTDAQNNRVVEYKAPLANGMSASLAIGQANLTRDLGSTTRSGLTTPFMALFDKSGDLWVSDFGNNRILEFTPPFSTGMNATLVLGQASFTTGDAADTQTGFYAPSGMAFDASGNLWVADTDNSRVLEFTAPFTSDMGASLVLGQLSFVSASSGTSVEPDDRPHRGRLRFRRRPVGRGRVQQQGRRLRSPVLDRPEEHARDRAAQLQLVHSDDRAERLLRPRVARLRPIGKPLGLRHGQQPGPGVHASLFQRDERLDGHRSGQLHVPGRRHDLHRANEPRRPHIRRFGQYVARRHLQQQGPRVHRDIQQHHDDLTDID